MALQNRCLVKGSINIDDFYSLPHIVRPGETISSTGFTRKPGGKGANQAYAVAKAGGHVDLDGCVGVDGRWISDLLKNGGVGTSRLRILGGDEVTGRAVIQSSADGENSIVLHKGANYHIPPGDASPDLSNYTHLLLQNEIPLKTTLSYLTAAAAKGVATVFNPSPMLLQKELRTFPWKDLTWLIINEGELGDLLDAFGDSESARQPSEKDLLQRAEQQLHALHENSQFSWTTSIICTLGAKGIIYFVPQGGQVKTGHLPAGKLERPIKDTTGAGDCFAGYFVAGLMSGLELEQALTACLTACAICVEGAGAMESYATSEEVQARIERT